MQLTIFENAYFLQALGIAIINSFWQTGLLWLLYKFFIAFNKNISATFKHIAGVRLLFISFIWFFITLYRSYFLLKNTGIDIFDKANIGVMPASPVYENIFGALSVFYILLLCFFTSRFLKHLKAVKFVYANGLSKASIDTRIFVNKISLHLNTKRKVQVWLCEFVDVPSVVGFIKPVILLPLNICSQLSTEQLEAILMHELAHIKRNDYFINILQSIVELVLFFNPFVWLLGNDARKERENACDDWVMNYQYSKLNYGNALLKLEEFRSQKPALALASNNGKMNLLKRIKRLDPNGSKTDCTSTQRFLIISFCTLFFVAMIAFAGFYQKPVDNFTIKKESELPLQIQRAWTNEHIPGEKIIKTSPIFAAAPVPTLTNKNIKKHIARYKKIHADLNDGGSYAFINKELLDNDPGKVIFTSEKTDSANNDYVIKIEEDQSGKSSTNVYYFELNKNNIQAILKPLVFLKQQPGKKIETKKTAFGRVHVRITS